MTNHHNSMQIGSKFFLKHFRPEKDTFFVSVGQRSFSTYWYCISCRMHSHPIFHKNQILVDLN